MIPRFEFGPLFKFLASIGLALLTASIALPWFILKDSTILLVPSAEIQATTPRAQRVLAIKQGHAEALAEVWPFLSAVLVLVGLGLLLYGIHGWARWQDRVDKNEELELELKRLGFARSARNETPDPQRESPIDVPDQIRADGISDSGVGRNTSREGTRKTKPDESKVSSEHPIAEQPSWIRRATSQLEVDVLHAKDHHLIEQVEASVLTKLKSAFSKNYSVVNELTTPGGLRADAVAMPAPPDKARPVFVFAIKHFRYATQHRVKKSMNELLRVSLEIPPSPSGRPVYGIGLILFNQVSSPDIIGDLRQEGFPIPYRVSPQLTCGLILMSRTVFENATPTTLRNIITESVPSH